TKFLILHVFPELLRTFPDLKIHLIGGPLSQLGEDVARKIQELNQQRPGCLEAQSATDLDQAMRQYRLIFAAGRVAISAFLQGLPLWAIGEYSSLGLTTASNFDQHCDSNFGDIGADAPSTRSAAEMIAQLSDFLKKPLPSLEERSHLQALAQPRFEFSR